MAEGTFASDYDYTGVATRELRDHLVALAPNGDPDTYMKGAGLSSRMIYRIAGEELPFTGLVLIDQLEQALGVTLHTHLNIIPSRQKGSSRRMAEDILVTLYECGKIDVEATKEASLEAGEQVWVYEIEPEYDGSLDNLWREDPAMFEVELRKRALKGKGHLIDAVAKGLEEQRDAILGEPTEEQADRIAKRRVRTKKYVRKHRAKAKKK